MEWPAHKPKYYYGKYFWILIIFQNYPNDNKCRWNADVPVKTDWRHYRKQNDDDTSNNQRNFAVHLQAENF